MAEDLGALTLLGESADWLKDAKGRSVADLRAAALEAYRAAWAAPTDRELHQALRRALRRLLRALRQNHLYPEDLTLGRDRQDRRSLLPDPRRLREDFESLRSFCVINKFGIGEIHLMYVVYVLCIMLYKRNPRAYDFMVEKAVGDALFLRGSLYRADNLAPFSLELKARFHTVRLMRAMRRFGLFDETPIEKLNAHDEAEARALLTDPLRSGAAAYVQKTSRFAYTIFDAAYALEEYVRARAGKEALVDARGPEELFIQLRHRLRHLNSAEGMGPVLRKRLLSLGIMAIVHSLAYADPVLGRKMYTFLRSEKDRPTLRHDQMFEMLGNDVQRLRLVNFLYSHAERNPMYYVDRFQRHFRQERLHFVSKEVGFTLVRPSAET